MVENLTKMFIARYSKRFSELNEGIFISPKDDNNNYEMPVITLGPAGGTINVGSGVFKLNNPAEVRIETKKMKGQMSLYRIAIPRSELEIADRRPEYFNYLMDTIINKALLNYSATFGDEKQVRFGSFYCTYINNNIVFRELNDDFYEIRLAGDWASNEEANA